jgi:tryptophan synthase beta chain
MEVQMSEESSKTRFILGETDLPKFWYNINGDSPLPPTPVLHPATMEPVTPDFLSVLFPMEIIQQEVSSERYIEIPEEVREIYKLYRPTPLARARRLEKALGTPAHIYYKNESVSPTGSHKPNTAIAQAFYNKKEGVKALTTETGAGQWGSALSFACCFFDIDLEVYMVKVSYNQKPYRRTIMETYGAQVFASPTDRTESGIGLEPRPDAPDGGR